MLFHAPALLEPSCMKLEHSLSCGGKMRTARRTLLRGTVIAAVAVTVLFGISRIFMFGAATHKDAMLSWNASSSNADLVQVICYRGQLHLTINFCALPDSLPLPNRAAGMPVPVTCQGLTSTSACRSILRAATALTCTGTAMARACMLAFSGCTQRCCCGA